MLDGISLQFEFADEIVRLWLSFWGALPQIGKSSIEQVNGFIRFFYQRQLTSTSSRQLNLIELKNYWIIDPGNVLKRLVVRMYLE